MSARKPKPDGYSRFNTPSTQAGGLRRPGELKNPLEGLPYTGKPESDSLLEIGVILEALRRADKCGCERANPLTVDSRHWFAVVFETRGQKDEFLNKASLFIHGDKYLVGKIVTEALGALRAGKGALASKPKLGGSKLSLGFMSKYGPKEPAKPEISETVRNIREDEKRTAEVLAMTSDAEYWFCICFDTESDLQSFTAAYGLTLETIPSGRFRLIHGDDFIAALNAKGIPMEITPAVFPYRPHPARPDAKLCDISFTASPPREA